MTTSACIHRLVIQLTSSASVRADKTGSSFMSSYNQTHSSNCLCAHQWFMLAERQSLVIFTKSTCTYNSKQLHVITVISQARCLLSVCLSMTQFCAVSVTSVSCCTSVSIAVAVLSTVIQCYHNTINTCCPLPPRSVVPVAMQRDHVTHIT